MEPHHRPLIIPFTLMRLLLALPIAGIGAFVLGYRILTSIGVAIAALVISQIVYFIFLVYQRKDDDSI
jgi:hypothetical protein